MKDIEGRATEIFCVIDYNNIIKHIPQAIPYGNISGSKGCHSIWNAPAVITLGILEFLYHTAEIKSFFNLVNPSLEGTFGRWISYERYMQVRSFYVPYTALCICLLIVPLKKTGLYLVGSAALPVCHIKRSSSNKVMEGITSKSKITKGGSLK